jgi:NAD(P)-dependent dehydrogenase (short-subunit alcohol dehydrogenase family)
MGFAAPAGTLTLPTAVGNLNPVQSYNILKNRTALITGASGGLGAAIAQELAAQGCRLILTGRNRERLGATADSVRSIAPSVHEHVADMADEKSLQSITGPGIEAAGPVDILVNCAGIFPQIPVDKATMKDFDECIAVNVRAPFFLIRHFAPLMAGRGWGRIVNIGSSSSFSGFRDTSIYCTAKHALLGLSRSLFQELKGRGVRVYCLAPASVQAGMGKVTLGQNYETFVRPEEVARYLSFIISFDAELISEEVRLNRMIVQ